MIAGYSVSALMVYARCPWQFYRTFVLREPPPVSAAMRAGTRIHKAIADHYRQPTLFGSPLEAAEQPLFDAFLASPFNRPPVASELPFSLPFGGITVRGRIDVVLGFDTGYEIVDFKSGSGQGREEIASTLQLPLYAIAVAEHFRISAIDLRYTYFFLKDSLGFSRQVTDSEFVTVSARVMAILEAIQQQQFMPPAGCECFACRRTPSPFSR